MFQNKSYEAINIENAGIMMKSTKSTLVNLENAGIVENSLKRIKIKFMIKLKEKKHLINFSKILKVICFKINLQRKRRHYGQNI